MKKSRKILRRVLCAVLVAAVAFGVTELWYYPRYRKGITPVTVETNNTPGEIALMSSNLRCIAVNDLGKKSWFYRADLIIRNIVSASPDIIGFQEGTRFHYDYLCERLPEYDSVITYRDKSLLSEGCPIFYRSDKYTLIDKGSFWLSETPEVMSKDWGAACYRICSYVILTENATDKSFVVFNTHLDHVSDKARINGVGVVLDKIKEFGSLPSVIIGDFNCKEGSKTYENVTENFLDAKYQTDSSYNICTFQDYGKQLNRKPIDYAMISKMGFSVNSYRVIDTLYDGVYPSDHFPILVNLTLD